jgi:hypothetical protein
VVEDVPLGVGIEEFGQYFSFHAVTLPQTVGDGQDRTAGSEIQRDQRLFHIRNMKHAIALISFDN